MENGVLWRVISLPREGEVNQLVPDPKSSTNEMRHLGVDRVFALARDRYFLATHVQVCGEVYNTGV